MDINEVMRLLHEYEAAVCEVARLTERLQEVVYSMDTTGGSDNDGMPRGSKISDPTSDMAIRLADTKEQLVMAKADAIDKRRKAYVAVNKIDDVWIRARTMKLYKAIGRVKE